MFFFGDLQGRKIFHFEWKSIKDNLCKGFYQKDVWTEFLILKSRLPTAYF